MTHDNHPDGCSPYDRHSTPGDNFGLAGCSSAEVREEELHVERDFYRKIDELTRLVQHDYDGYTHSD